ncbi:hypothetical protein JY651_27470 [Pyxidicoccus parkwayensis]|uniref:Small-conductance mechanosensitive channel n=1 Tax=Pyxidicoccus parkwayensis TaxID=2813578 RepID=A0ABX7NNI5_9BACT|nr:hypothetical protein [Pyxidicoccus parkwaysis]QSQ19087.1 hypothetical protein JY651_27470 [Pyxidicoccus parkwaysis]
MSTVSRKTLLVLSVLLLLVLPVPGSLLMWGGLPRGFGVFPAQQAGCPETTEKCEPGFNAYYFAFCCLVAVFVLAFFLVPKWFGFKSAGASEARSTKAAEPGQWPWWLLPGVVTTVVSWAVLWMGRDPSSLYTFVPLWWGFIVTVDACVYKRTGGNSILARSPGIILWLALSSLWGWYIFEYLNWFVMENWYYPNNELLSPLGYRVWYTLSYTTVWPAVFEWYTLLRTSSWLRTRYSRGPKVSLSRRAQWGVFLGAAVAIALTGRFPFALFFMLWLGPLFFFSGVLLLFKSWTPYSPILGGDWSQVMTMALAGLCNGFFWELWNFGSEFFNGGAKTNPNFWKYEIPYINVLHFFSEMPLLGYFGYLPFGVLCWMWWLMMARFFNLKTTFENDLEAGPEPVIPVAEQAPQHAA